MKQIACFLMLLLATPPVFGQSEKQGKVDLIQGVVDKTFAGNSILAGDIHSLIVNQNGSDLYTQYWNGFDPDRLNNLKSITKSIMGLLVGIAIEQGHIQGVEESMMSYFKGCPTDEGMVKDKKGITIEHLLLMQSGISWNNRAPIKDDWWYHETPHCFLLNEFPMDTVPGIRFSYNSAVAHLLSGIISRSTGQSTLEFAKEHLFDPLQITDITWTQDRSGEYYGNSELSLKPKDLLKIGTLLLNKGRMNGREIISESSIRQMTAKAYDATTFMNYGYLWMTSKSEEPYFYFAGGSGGQHLLIVPEKNLIVVTTAHWDNARSTMEIMQLAVDLINQL